MRLFNRNARNVNLRLTIYHSFSLSFTKHVYLQYNSYVTKHNKHVVTTGTFVHALTHDLINISSGTYFLPLLIQRKSLMGKFLRTIKTNHCRVTDFHLPFLRNSMWVGKRQQNYRVSSRTLPGVLFTLLWLRVFSQKTNILTPTERTYQTRTTRRIRELRRSCVSSHEKRVIYTTIAVPPPFSPLPFASSKRIMCRSFHADRSNCTSRTESIYFHPTLNRHLRLQRVECNNPP